MKAFGREKRVLPEFPRTHHLPWKPVATRDDLVVPEAEADVIFQNPHTVVQEKVDGANCGMALLDGHPVIRSHQHILRKGFQKDTPAKKQFAPIWTWFYKNRSKFEKLEVIAGSVGVYGEWMVQQHGMVYDHLPDWFIAYDLYDYEQGKFLEPQAAIQCLVDAGFAVVPVLKVGVVESYEELEALAGGESPFAPGQQREGIYVKVSDGSWQTHRFKMIRQGFVQGSLLEDRQIKRNSLRKGDI